MKKNNQGFTLIEVMVAVGVIAIALPALMFSMMTQIDGSAYLRDKLQAQWVAENILTEIRIENRLTGSVPNSDKSGTEELGGRDWYWQTRSKAFAQKDFSDIYGVEVSVWTDETEKKEDALIKLVGIIRMFNKDLINRVAPEVLPRKGVAAPDGLPAGGSGGGG